MLKSTYKPSASAPPPLAPGWTEHTAPTGHTYYHNTNTKESTYVRPSAPAPAAFPSAPTGAAGSIGPNAPPMYMGNLADPRAANAFMQTHNPAFKAHAAAQASQREAQRLERQNRPKAQPIDKPKRKVAIPGCDPWVLVYTKYGRRFAYNPIKKMSYWRMPEKVLKGVLELDMRGVKEKAGEMGLGDAKEEAAEDKSKGQVEEEEEDSSEYEEIEVTDSEGEGDGDGHPSKRQRMENIANTGPLEFSEADIAAQLAAMQEDDGMAEEFQHYPDEEDEEMPLSEEDAQQLFHDLLDDFHINPYSSWDKLVEEGKTLDDPRYTCLPTTKARHESFDTWSRLRIQTIKEARAKEAKKDPRLPYLDLLATKATTKLYWPEFKRKFRKEEAMKDSKLPDRDREKLFRDYVTRLKLPTSTLQRDLTILLKAQPIKILNNQTPSTNLPSCILADLRYVGMDPTIRDPLVEAYISSLPAPPAASSADMHDAEEDDEVAVKARAERQRREYALRQREDVVAEKRRREERTLVRERALLREDKREIDAAMHVDRSGLLKQLREDAGKEGKEI